MTTVIEPGALEVAKPADLIPGTYVVISGVGLMQVKGPRDLDGKPGMEFSDWASSYTIELDDAKDPTIVRAVISKAEAERRLALLEDTTPVTDTRSAKERNVEYQRTLARGTDIQTLELLRAAYASTFAADNQDMRIYDLEEKVLAELVHVLGDPSSDVPGFPPSHQPSWEKLVERLHAIHAERGTYAMTAKPRPPDPAPAPPKDPWGIQGHEYVGTFTLEGDHLIVGDPIYVTSWHDEAPQEVTKNVRIAATAGRWHCYLELDPADPHDVSFSFSFIAIHDSAREEFAGARRRAAPVAKLWVDRGEMSAVDSAIRDDVAYDDDRLFGADDHGIIGGRGCKVPSGSGDGTYTTRVLEQDGKAIYVHVDFTGESRDFLEDARTKLKL